MRDYHFRSIMIMIPFLIGNRAGYPNQEVMSVTLLLISAKGVGTVGRVSKANYLNVHGETMTIVITCN